MAVTLIRLVQVDQRMLGDTDAVVGGGGGGVVAVVVLMVLPSSVFFSSSMAMPSFGISVSTVSSSTSSKSSG